MRKLKLLPTILMLVLCVGVLAIGVFAITPTKNTITGTITIGAAPSEVQIDCYVGDSTGTPTSFPSVRTGITWEPNLNLSTGTANTVAEIPEYELTIKITNKSDKELGVYFLQGTLADDGIATGENVRTEATLTERDLVDDEGNYIDAEKANPKDLVDFKFDVYKYIAPKTDEAGKVVEMKIYYKCADFIDADGKVKFNYYLNIEEYKPNVGTAEELAAGTVQYAATASTFDENGYVTKGSSSVTTDFVKLSKNITALGGARITGYASLAELSFYNNTNIKYVVGTNKLTTIGRNIENVFDIMNFWKSSPAGITSDDCYYEGPFEECSNLKWFSFNAVTTYGVKAFAYCASLTEVKLRNASVDYMAFASCTQLKNVEIGTNVTLKHNEYEEYRGQDISTGKDIYTYYYYSSIFNNCSLDNLVLKSVPQEAINAFKNCTIANVKANIETEDYTFVNGVFTTKGTKTTLEVPTGLRAFVKELYATDAITSIGSSCTYLSAVTIIDLSNASITNLTNGFTYSSISKVILPKTMTSISTGSFEFSTLQEVIFPTPTSGKMWVVSYYDNGASDITMFYYSAMSKFIDTLTISRAEVDGQYRYSIMQVEVGSVTITPVN